MPRRHIEKYCGHCNAIIDKLNQVGTLFYKVDGKMISRTACFECADEEHKEADGEETN